MKKLFFAIILLLGFGIQKSSAQDKMILRYKADTLIVKIMEIGTEEVKYKLWPLDESMPIMVESKDRIKRVILANGTVLRFTENEFMNANNYATQKKAAIKIDMFSIMMGTTSISYEQVIEPGRSWEAGIGMIGLGANNDNMGDRSGAFFRAGYKFINQPDFYMKGMRYTHILKGGYIRPEIVVQVYNQKETTHDYLSTGNYPNYVYTVTTTDKTLRYTGYGFMLNFGKQWVFSDIFLVDLFVGGGLGFGNKTTVNSSSSSTNTNGTGYYYYNYNDDTSGSNPLGTGFGVNSDGEVGFVGQFGLKLGVLLGSKNLEK